MSAAAVPYEKGASTLPESDGGPPHLLGTRCRARGKRCAPRRVLGGGSPCRIDIPGRG